MNAWNMYTLLALWIASSATPALAAGCPQDKALFPTATPTLYSSLSSFCNTYTTTINIQSTGLPARVTQGCSLDRYKISSACSCNPGNPTSTTVKTTASCAPTPSINIVKNGGFECGLAPWVFTPNAPGYTYHFFSVGDNSQYNIILEGRGPDNNTYATLSQNVAGTVVGQAYSLTYRTTYDYCYVGRDTIILRALLNGRVVDTVDVCSLPNPGQLYYVNRGVGFTATSNPTTLTFQFLNYNEYNDYEDVYIDNVVIGKA